MLDVRLCTIGVGLKEEEGEFRKWHEAGEPPDRTDVTPVGRADKVAVFLGAFVRLT